MRIVSLLIMTALLASGCTQGTPSLASYMASDSYRDRPELTESLFPEDQAVLSNEAIAQILSSKITLPTNARIAVIRVGQPQHRWWSQDLAHLDEEVVTRFLSELAGCERIADASLMPSLLVPRRVTVPLVRAAAARYQADLVILYQATTRTYTKQRFFAADETKSHCVVEAVLLDTRTGMVPFSSIASESYGAKRSSDDLSFAETMWKAELTATGRALDKIAAEVVAFLDSIQ